MMTVRAFLIALLLLPGWALAQQSPPPAQQTTPPAPETLFGAPLVDLAGKPVSLAQFRGQPLLINFWRWCGPCRTEIPQIVTEYDRAKIEKTSDAGVQVIGIALDDKPDAVRDFAKAYGIDYPVLLLKDNGPDLLKQLGNPQAGLPYTLVVQRDGKIVGAKLGAMTREQILAALKAAGEAPK